jgi:hypothetical protein
MAAFNKVDIFVQDLARGVHILTPTTGHVLRVFLSNDSPLPTSELKSNLTEIAAGNGYISGGNQAVIQSSVQTTGTYRLILSDPPTFTALGGSIGPFRYIVLYNSTTAFKTNPLIGWWDYGSSITVADGESFAVDFDQSAGVLVIS